MPFAPPNAPATIVIDAKRHVLQVDYNGRRLVDGRFSEGAKVEVVPGSDPDKIEQTVLFSGGSIKVDGTIHTSSQAFAAETFGDQQRRFPLVRNSDGPSFNLRNNAVYDREQDAVLIGSPDGSTRITPKTENTFHFAMHGANVKLIFRPHYYQRHKNLSFFQPWDHPLKTRPIAGWCSWWAYRDAIDDKTVIAAADVFARKLKPFGYDIIQLDDGYQKGEGAPPDFWLKTNSKFGSGLASLARQIRAKGMEPGIWIGTQIFDDAVTQQHPGWFVQDPGGKPHKGPWIGYGVDGSKSEALEHLYAPEWDEFRQANFSYVKIDSLRHLLYDSLYPCRPQMQAEGVTPEQAFRDYLKFARQRLGADTYILACWGVLPEVAGIADGCRLGGDGFGPSTMQQYNSWNNVVWRNDPDHVDLQGAADAILRPTLVSLAGAQLLLSDKVEFYENDANLEGAKRSSPVPLTLPGQLYDYDPSKSDNLIKGLRNQNGGSNAGPLDASQNGHECPWWQLDISRSFENWTVLGRLSWNAQPQQEVRFRDLGLPKTRYAVYEFWSRRYLGEFENEFPAEAQAAKAAHVYCIRTVQDHPQVISTSRHITQGGADLLNVDWNSHARTLSGTSQTVAQDPYEIRIRLGGRKAAKASSTFTIEGDLLVLKWTPLHSGRTGWWVRFS